jgi:Alkylmercury lyase
LRWWSSSRIDNVDDTFDINLRTAVYRHFATTGRSPMLDSMREAVGATSEQVRDGYRRLYAKRMLLPAGDFESIRMAPPFSGVPTQHRAIVNGTEYYANCAWDVFGVVSALGGTGDVLSRCEQTLEALALRLSADGPPSSGWLFHCVVPAAEWWNDIVFT